VPTPYRTTAAELDAYRSEGVLTTELTTASVFAAAAALGVRAASGVIVTRNLPSSVTPPGSEWHPTKTRQLLDAAVEAIQSQAEQRRSNDVPRSPGAVGRDRCPLTPGQTRDHHDRKGTP
jgi:hypothetical protein